MWRSEGGVVSIVYQTERGSKVVILLGKTLEYIAVTPSKQYTMFHVSRTSLYTGTQCLAALVCFNAFFFFDCRKI